MTVMYEAPQRQWPSSSASTLGLEDKFDVLKEIGDGSFGSVALARVRSAGAQVARRGTLVAVKTMKKTFDSYSHCLELREVIFLRTLPSHPHLVPALDIFLDPMTKKLHIAMEYMDGNLYQLMKARDHKYLDGASVKSILFQIISGLEHIHENSFFHRDIKPENILVSTSAPHDTASTFKRYSALVTPPSTPPAYTIKIADFGLARETQSKLPYTTYVSTRWYRAPEVLLRAGEYSAPVDIWAIGAMAVEIATLKPLFPGGNEVDQVWRICEIMGSPGAWVNKHGVKVGGGEWKDGVKLAQKLGFSFPKMAPHSLDAILRPPQWPTELSEFVTWCLLWDPKARPTSTQALAHAYFKDAADPLRPKSSKLLGRKQSNISANDSLKDASDSLPSLTSKTSNWFRKSLIQREQSAPVLPQLAPALTTPTRPAAVQASSESAATTLKPSANPNASKRATWTNGLPANAAPIPILPSIRPISPLPNAVTAQATERASKKIGRQLSVASHGNHYTDVHRQEAERALNGTNSLASPTHGGKEGFFSHLRKRARRFSGRYATPVSPSSDDIEANAGCGPWQTGSNRQSMVDSNLAPIANPVPSNDFSELDKALQNVRSSLEASRGKGAGVKRHHSLAREYSSPNGASGSGSTRPRKAVNKSGHSSLPYDTPDEEDELLDEALTRAHDAAKNLDTHAQPQTYLTPASSAHQHEVGYGQAQQQTANPAKALDIAKPRQRRADYNSKWPTPPYEESEWAAAAIDNIFSIQQQYR
ncbi:meiosis induction protein kinase-like protein [Venturia nashicola]|uniref:Meiosis induction protein kinase-like protein n=1 Tax=Venturia nashicola TaxID=86259 RepID=A0A4Z1P5N9_9PEZI|nr:meiosis induction protein kinase-like protein [Venturia nashicola]TLD34928.1 meiosis induction protein kinase-like protein [Venturia nashicola]